jgi:S-adenosylmethionine:tRNA ribosyltransferase-isomerase
VRTDELDFDLPDDLIARHPPTRRGDSRLMTFDRATDAIEHRAFADLPTLLRPGDVVVFNDARVTPAKFVLLKPTGGRVNALFLEEESVGRWIALLKGPGETATELPWQIAGGPAARVTQKLGAGRFRLEVDDDRPADDVLAEAGEMPLPPYLGRDAEPEDAERYQTVYADKPGSVAAPTAGLHFTPELLQKLDDAEIFRATLTLHVGLGTFRPVSSDDLDGHKMHRERYALPPLCCEAINEARRAGGRVVAVGTTVCRVLASQPAGELRPVEDGETSIFLRPPEPVRHVDALLTNFHLPRSTLIALVAAFVGLDNQRRLYREAIERQYRFFSYGDAMLLQQDSSSNGDVSP